MPSVPSPFCQQGEVPIKSAVPYSTRGSMHAATTRNWAEKRENAPRATSARRQKIEESALPESEALVVVLSGVSLHFRLGRAEPMIVGYDLRKTAEMAIN